MTSAEILERIKSTVTADLDADTVFEIYAHLLSNLEERLSESDLRGLILLGAAMYKHSVSERGAELQLPISTVDAYADFFSPDHSNDRLH